MYFGLDTVSGGRAGCEWPDDQREILRDSLIEPLLFDLVGPRVGSWPPTQTLAVRAVPRVLERVPAPTGLQIVQ